MDLATRLVKSYPPSMFSSMSSHSIGHISSSASSQHLNTNLSHDSPLHSQPFLG